VVEKEGDVFVGLGEDRFLLVEFPPVVERLHKVLGFVSIPCEEGWWGAIESITSVSRGSGWGRVLGDCCASCYSRHNVNVGCEWRNVCGDFTA
jgi:hypothetical protein